MKWMLIWIAMLVAWAIFRGSLPLLAMWAAMYVFAGSLLGDGK